MSEHPSPGPVLTASVLDRDPFSAQQCDALFANVLIDDRIDPDTALPAAIHLDYEREQIMCCFRLCRQVWKAGVDRRQIARTASALYRFRSLSPDGQRAFKHVRAKFKHLRFAYANFDDSHRYPFAFHRITTVMGRLQDAFKNGHIAAIRYNAFLLQLWTLRPAFGLVQRETDRYRPSTTDGFRGYVLDQIAAIRRVLASDRVTGKQFHETRKIISRQVALYDSLRTLYPSAYHNGISRYLSAINGLMGGMHDTLIAAKIQATQDYHADTFAFPDEIRRRLTALVERYPQAA